jgi:hypothetical protein
MQELGELSYISTLCEPASEKTHGSLVYRGWVDVPTIGKVRAECIVRPWPREEGVLPQLVAVRIKTRK